MKKSFLVRYLFAPIFVLLICVNAFASQSEWLENLPASVELRPMGEELNIQGRPTLVWLMQSKLEVAELVSIFREAMEGDVIVGDDGKQVFISRLGKEGLDLVNIKSLRGQLTGYVAISKPSRPSEHSHVPEWIPTGVKVLSFVHSRERGWRYSQWVLESVESAEFFKESILSGLAKIGWRQPQSGITKSAPDVINLSHPLNQGALTLVVSRQDQSNTAVLKIKRRAAMPESWP